jgi:hypothetical protein
VTEPTRTHAHFDELAAGHALHALDPDDELRFARHLPGCRRCQDALGDYTDVTGGFADTGSDNQPSQQLGARIMAAVALEPREGPVTAHGGLAGDPDGVRGDGQASESPAVITGLSHRRARRRLRVILTAAAAAVVLLAGAGSWAGLSHGSGVGQPLASCTRTSPCHKVVLTAAGSRSPSADVVIRGQSVWLVPSGLPADKTSGHIYVLWQITGAHTPLAVGSFDVNGHSKKPVRIGSLAVPYHGTWAFAVSLERGRTIPAKPSRPVALGQVS